MKILLNLQILQVHRGFSSILSEVLAGFEHRDRPSLDLQEYLINFLSRVEHESLTAKENDHASMPRLTIAGL
jgi:hypothetical protein